MEDDNKEQFDFFNQQLKPGDIVLAADGHALEVYAVLYLTNKMVRVKKVRSKKERDKGKLRYGKELYKIENKLATFYLMQHR